MRPTMLLCAVVALVSASACADEMSEEEARMAMRATANALSDGSAAAAASKSDALVLTHACEDGGELAMDGDFGGIGIGFDIGAKMTSCTRDGITMTGELTYVLLATNAIAAKTLQYTYTGTMTYSGEVEGTCDVAMTGQVVEVAGVAGIATWAGKMCDFDGTDVMVGVSITLR